MSTAIHAKATKTTLTFMQLRLIKLGLVLLFALAAGIALSSSFWYITSNNAVISTTLIALRSPIEGYVSGLDTHVGANLPTNIPILNVRNLYVDETRLNQMVLERNSKISELAGLNEELQDLGALKVKYKEGGSGFLATQIRAWETRREYALKSNDKTLLAATDRLLSSAENGTLLGNLGPLHITYSAQRADEIEILETNVLNKRTTIKGQISDLEKAIAVETARVKKFTEASIKTIDEASVWKLGATNGERVNVGDSLVELVDCSKLTMFVSIPQKRFGDVAIGQMAKFKLSGDTNPRFGKVLAVTAPKDLKTSHFAAMPIEKEDAVIVTLAVDPIPGETCPVGRTASVLIPITNWW